LQLYGIILTNEVRSLHDDTSYLLTGLSSIWQNFNLKP